jgi:Helicase associated domain
VEVLREDLPHVVAYEKTQLASIIPTPEIWNRWMNYPKLETILHKYNMPKIHPKKRTRGDHNNNHTDENDTNENTNENNTEKSNKELKFTPEEAKVLLTSLRKEYIEQKNIIQAIEAKLAKSEQLHFDLIRHAKEKQIVEAKLAKLETTTSPPSNHVGVEEETTMTESTTTAGDTTDPVTGEPTDASPNNSSTTTAEKKRSSTVISTSDQIKATLVKKKQKLELMEAKVSKALVCQIHGKPPSESHMSWDQRYEQLVEFQKEYGHCDVPLGWEPNPALYYWVFNQRQRYRWKKKIMTPARG